MKFKINPTVFHQFPNLIVYIPVITGFNNKPSDEVKQRILEYKTAQEAKLRSEFQNTDQLLNDPRIKSYLDAFSMWGADTKNTLPTHLSLAKRVIESASLPVINPIVDLYNSLSIKYLTPFGGEDLSVLYGDLELTLATGGEHFLGIKAIKAKSPLRNELIWQDDFDVTTRCLNWRQCERTKLTENSHDGWFIMDGFIGVNKDNIHASAQEFSEKVIQLLGGLAQMLLLDQDQPEAEINYQTKSITGVKKPTIQLIEQSKEGKHTPNNNQIKQAKQTLPQIEVAHQIQQAVQQALANINIEVHESDIYLEHPNLEQHGDYTTNIAMTLFGKLKSSGNTEHHSPRTIAKTITDYITNSQPSFIAKVEIAGPGFINFHLSSQALKFELQLIEDRGREYGSNNSGAGQTWLLEHTSPNPNKAMHLGHLRNNVTGMAIGNLWETQGITVIRDCIDNNRGIAIAKLMWGYLKFAHKQDKQVTDLGYWHQHQSEWQTPEELNLRPDRFVDQLYVKGSDDFKNPDVEQPVRQLVVDWEAHDQKTWDLWGKVLEYSHKGQKLTLDRLGNHWDHIWHEHEHYQEGKDLVEAGLQKGTLKKLDNGAILTNLEKDFGLTDTIVIKADGTSLYITQDLALTRKKKKAFHPDKMHWVIGPEQALAMKQVFAVCDQLGIINYENCHHIPYGYMSIKGQGKMSSREGNVVYIDELIDQVKTEILKTKIFKNSSSFEYDAFEKIMKKHADGEFDRGKRPEITAQQTEAIAENIAIGAIKYSILRTGRMTNTAFDIDESIAIQGNSGPYLQYTHARCHSVIEKVGEIESVDINALELNPEESAVLRHLYRFPEIVIISAAEFAPNHICTYLFELAQRYNAFYNKHQVINANTPESKYFRVQLTKATKQIIFNGLKLLGITAPEKM